MEALGSDRTRNQHVEVTAVGRKLRAERDTRIGRMWEPRRLRLKCEPPAIVNRQVEAAEELWAELTGVGVGRRGGVPAAESLGSSRVVVTQQRVCSFCMQVNK